MFGTNILSDFRTCSDQCIKTADGLNENAISLSNSRWRLFFYFFKKKLEYPGNTVNKALLNCLFVSLHLLVTNKEVKQYKSSNIGPDSDIKQLVQQEYKETRLFLRSSLSLSKVAWKTSALGMWPKTWISFLRWKRWKITPLGKKSITLTAWKSLCWSKRTHYQSFIQIKMFIASNFRIVLVWTGLEQVMNTTATAAAYS